MASDDQSGARPAGPVVLRIKLRYDDLDTMVQRFAVNVGKSGLFLPTKTMQPIGTEVKFELRLSNDTPVLVGLGRVKHVKPHDPARPKAAFGLAIELMRVSREGREVIIKMIERRRVLGLPEVAIPVPDDVDAARRSDVETQPRADTSGIVREAMREFASAPVAEQVLSAPPVAEHKPAAAAAVRESVPVVARESASLLTSPRQGSGPIPAAALDGGAGRRTVPVLAPEATKPKRPRAVDLMSRANELADRLATTELQGLDAHVDVARALARARALAGTDLDGELAALRESAAAPLEISIEAASAELARQLGGAPIAKRDRSTKLAAVTARATKVAEAVAPPPETDFVAKTRAPTEASPAAALAAVTALVEVPVPEAVVDVVPAVEAAPIVEAAPVEPALVEPALVEPALPVEAPGDDAVAEYAVDQKTRVPSGEELDGPFLPSVSTTTAIDPDDSLEVPVEPLSFAAVNEDLLRTSPGDDLRGGSRSRTGSEGGAQLIEDSADEAMLRRALEGSSPAMKLDESDLEEVDEEDRGDSTQIGAFPIDPSTFPQAPDDLSAQLDRQLVEAEAEAEAEFREMANVDAAPAPYSIQPYASEYGEPEPADPSEEISDLDVLAEADAGDADLLTANAEREASQDAAVAYHDPDEGDPQPYVEPPVDADAELPAFAEPEPPAEPPVFPDELPGFEDPLRPSQEDFAARLDLDDEPDEEERRNFPSANPRPRSRSDSRGESPPPPVADFHDPPSESYTFAEPFPAPSLLFAPNPVGEDFDEPHGFTQNTPVPASRGRSASRGPDSFEQSSRGEHDDPVARALQSFDEPSHPQAQPAHDEPTEDLEDALAALDVDLDPQVQEQRRTRRKTGGPRPLPGLPVQRATGPTPVAQPVRTRTTGANVIARSGAAKQPTMPPPVPVRKSGTTPPPLPVHTPPKRATTDDGIMIDFDDDE